MNTHIDNTGKQAVPEPPNPKTGEAQTCYWGHTWASHRHGWMCVAAGCKCQGFGD